MPPLWLVATAVLATVSDSGPLATARAFRAAQRDLLALGAATDRGQVASNAQRAAAVRLIHALESSPLAQGDPELLYGEWKLVYATEAAYRASPFFAAFRKLAAGMDAAVTPRNAASSSLADAVYAVTDGIPFKSVGMARQSISPTRLVSQIELFVTLFDALLPRASSLMTSTAAVLPRATDGPAPPLPLSTALRVQKTQVLRSSIAQLAPFMSIDDIAFPTADLFERVRPGSADIELVTSVLSGGAPDDEADGSQEARSAGIRISRYEPGGGTFVWARCGPDEEPVLLPPGNDWA